MQANHMQTSSTRRTLLACAGRVAFFIGPLAAAAVLMPASLHAQTAGTASIQGTVKDSTGAVVPNAAVVFTSSERVHAAK